MVGGVLQQGLGCRQHGRLWAARVGVGGLGPTELHGVNKAGE